MNYTNVLIVEDEAVIAADVRLMVEDLGFTALGIASSGEEGLRKAEALRPDLVLMDIKIKGDMDCLVKPLEPSELENILLGSAESLSM